MKRVRQFWTQAWRPLLGAGAGTLALLFLYTYRLGSLAPGVDTTEGAIYDRIATKSVSLLSLVRDAFYLPHEIAHYILQFLPFHKAGSIRFASALVAIAACLSFYYIVKSWHSRRLALFATALFACSSWLLHIGRYGGSDILYVLPLLFLAAFVWQQNHRGSRTGWIAVGLLAAFSLYIPGLLWVILPGVVWQRKRIAKMFRNGRVDAALISAVLALVLCIPLLLTIVWPQAGTTILHNVLLAFGLPQSLSLDSISTSATAAFKTLFWKGSDPTLNVGALPLLDIFTIAMAVIGTWVYIRDYKLDRSRWILSYLGVALLLAILGGVSVSILLPVVYLLVAEGLAFMIITWLTVFPRNPVARGIGLGVVAAAIGIVASYHLISYFVAWPHTEATQASFTRQL